MENISHYVGPTLFSFYKRLSVKVSVEKRVFLTLLCK